jgi:hypothetical protein
MPRANFVVYEDFLPLEERLFFSSSSYSPCIIGLGYLASNPHTTPHNIIYQNYNIVLLLQFVSLQLPREQKIIEKHFDYYSVDRILVFLIYFDF